MRWLLLLLVGSATPRANETPAEECTRLLRQADAARSFKSAGNVAAGRLEDNSPINPCVLGCRIPKCGYPAN